MRSPRLKVEGYELRVRNISPSVKVIRSEHYFVEPAISRSQNQESLPVDMLCNRSLVKIGEEAPHL